MKTLIRMLLGIVTVLVLLAAVAVGGFWWFLSQTADEMCGNRVIDTIGLSGIDMRVVVFRRDCGATTGFSTQVSLLESGEALENESGNLFSADTNRGNAPKGEGGGPKVRVEVIAVDRIKILHHPDARVFLRRNEWRGMKIGYGYL